MHSSKKVHVSIPEDIIKVVDAQVGQHKRSQWIIETIREKLARMNLVEAIDSAAGSWKEENHPELKDGSDKWVRSLRESSEERHYRIKTENE